MRTLGLLALAGAGLAMLLCTDKGKALTKQAGEKLREGYDGAAERMGQPKPVEAQIEKALEQPHPDTVMAHAFGEAIGAS